MAYAKPSKKDYPESVRTSIRNTYDHEHLNYRRFRDFMRYTFSSTLTSEDEVVASALQKPLLQFNIMEAYVSRQLGEFSKQEPSVDVSMTEGAEVDSETLKIVTEHLRHILFESNRNGFEYDVYSDLLGGGFSAAKVYADYPHPMATKQVLKIERVYDPTMAGFDPLAKNPSKSDGRYCFCMYPLAEDEFLERYPGKDRQSQGKSSNFSGYHFGYSRQKEKTVLLCEFYEKKKKKVRIVETVTGKVMTTDDYKKFVELWNASGEIRQAPGIVGKPRSTIREIICRYILTQNEVLEYEETTLKSFPYIYIDGNSKPIYVAESNDRIRMTRPYVYNLWGLQRLKNFAGMTLANELENLIQHKFMVAKESLPAEDSPYIDAYKNIQQADTVVYHAYDVTDPSKPVPPPQTIQRVAIPPEIMGTFGMTDQMSQSILGSYDASLGINNKQLSGVAIVEGATQSNAAAMPYIVNFMKGLTQIANVCIEIFPDIYTTKRTIPIQTVDGKKSHVMINVEGAPSFNYDDNALQVKVEAGLNYQLQKYRTLETVVSLANSSPAFAQFFNEKGLKVIVENLDWAGSDELKPMAEEWMQEQAQLRQQQQQQAQQQAQQPNPLMMRAENERMKIEQDAKVSEMEFSLKAQSLQLEEVKNKLLLLDTLIKAHSENAHSEAQKEKAIAEQEKAAVMALKEHTHTAKDIADMMHRHTHDIKKHDLEERKHAHNVESSKQPIIEMGV